MTIAQTFIETFAISTGIQQEIDNSATPIDHELIGTVPKSATRFLTIGRLQKKETHNEKKFWQ